MCDGDAHNHVLQVDDAVVGVVGAARRLVHRSHHVLRSDGSGNTCMGNVVIWLLLNYYCESVFSGLRRHKKYPQKIITIGHICTHHVGLFQGGVNTTQHHVALCQCGVNTTQHHVWLCQGGVCQLLRCRI